MKHLTIILASILLLSACTGHFDELNSNPNNPPETHEDFIFNYVIKEVAGEYGFLSSYNITYVQRWAMQTATVYGNSTMPPYTLFDQFRIQNLWEYFYSDLLVNCSIIEEMTDPVKNGNEELMTKYQVARIWKAFIFHKVTDLWGDVPYSEAFKLLESYSKDNIKPGYDPQEEIYEDLIAILAEAVENLDEADPFYTDDLLFDGDVNMWIKFANSLRLRLAVRSGNSAVVAEILSGDTENELISSSTESVRYEYPDNQNWWNPYYDIHISSDNPSRPEETGTSVAKISELMMRQLQDHADPRLEVYAQTAEVDNSSYRGVPNLMNANLKENQAMKIGTYTTSYIGTHFTRNAQWKQNVLTHAEVCFLRAEAAQRGWSGENAQEWYEEGVRSAMALYDIGVTDSTQVDDFLAGTAAFDNSLEQIITQKWVALFLNGWEAFAEYRRTGYPQLMKWDLELDGTRIISAEWVEVPREYLPGRLPYPDDEKDLNTDNYHTAVDAMGGDLYKQQLWWSELFGEVAYDGAY